MINSLQSLRFLFALMIFAHHYFIPQIEPFGSFPVAFFFILSGFVMTLGYGDKVEKTDFSYKEYITRRLMRLLPLNIICLLFYYIRPTLLDLVVGQIQWERFNYFIVDALLLQSWIPLKSVYYSGNVVSWFLSVILFLNLIFPLLIRRIKRINVYLFIISIIVIYLFIIQFVPTEWVHPLIYINPIFRLTDYIIGIALAILFKHNQGKYNCTLLQLVALLVSVISVLLYPFIPISYSYASLYWIPSVLLIISFGQKGRVSSILESKNLVYLGSISFPFYMLHMSIIYWWILIEGHLPYKNQAMGAVICVCFIVILSHCYAKYMEPYIIKKIQRVL